ncbi:MAG: hypothetical protein ACRELG_25170 [Gemmataceae bacterium]
MTRSDLLARLRQKPFRPFRLLVSEGGVYDVRHPESIMVARDHAIVGVSKDPEQDFHDSTVMIDLYHVVSLEPLEATAPAGGNGAGK